MISINFFLILLLFNKVIDGLTDPPTYMVWVDEARLLKSKSADYCDQYGSGTSLLLPTLSPLYNAREEDDDDDGSLKVGSVVEDTGCGGLLFSEGLN
ncbi:hypothetical protein OPV22_012804 [Ensete ventricosum]|uniref:Uncharacterized protein n=1 Tax=Ensete ventricosum TaxID=4639 RepID=A0AAV8R5Y0_ENSVE|nr:hypothetical protein OPV22_012804 [Ensete ventricosum]